MSTLLMAGLAGSVLLSGMLILTGSQVLSAKRGKTIREQRLQKSNVASISHYVQLALRSRWCLRADLTRDLSCLTSHERSLERLIVNQENWEDLVGTSTPYPGPYAMISGQIGCSSSSLLTGTDLHPLRTVLQELDEDYGCIKWSLRRACSAGGGGSATSCPAAAALFPTIGDETYYSLKIELIPKDSRILDLGAGAVTGEQIFAIVPRSVSSYAAIFKGDLSANYTYSGGHSSPSVATDSMIRFPSGTSSDAMVSFHGPVLTNGDFILPYPGDTTSPFVRVQFNDAVYLEGGRVLTSNPAFTPPTKRSYPAFKTLQLFSSSGQFGGLKAGVVQDSSKDHGLNCIFAETYQSTGDSLPERFAQGCGQSTSFERMSAVLWASDRSASKTANSDVAIKKCTTSTSDQGLGCPSTAPAATLTSDDQSLFLGLTERNFFYPQVNMSAITPVVNHVASDSFSVTAVQTAPTFPAQPRALSSAFSGQVQWASFTFSGSQPDPRLEGTRNKPILRLHLVRENASDFKLKSVLARTELGVRDQVTFNLQVDLAREPSANTLWYATFCGTDNTGSCPANSSPDFWLPADSNPGHPLAPILLNSACLADALDPTLGPASLGMRLRQTACQLGFLDQTLTAYNVCRLSNNLENCFISNFNRATMFTSAASSLSALSLVTFTQRARYFLRAQFKTLYTLFQKSGQATGAYGFDRPVTFGGTTFSAINSDGVLGAPGTFQGVGAVSGVTAVTPSLTIETFPVPHQHPLLPLPGSSDEPDPRYYWRSDRIRLQTSLRNADLFPDALRRFQIEFEVFDSQAMAADGLRSGVVRTMDAANRGPNCSRFSNTSITAAPSGQTVVINDAGANCSYGALIQGDEEIRDTNAGVHRYFRKSPNLIRYALQSRYPGVALPVQPTEQDRLSLNTATSATLLNSCLAPDPGATATALDGQRQSLSTSWQVMRCPGTTSSTSAIPAFSAPNTVFFPGSTHPIGAQWSVVPPTNYVSSPQVLNHPAFRGEVPELLPDSFDPMELLFYDFFKVGGTDVLQNLESFAAATARTSWTFSLPTHFDLNTLDIESGEHLVIAGGDPREASDWIENQGKPITRYDSAGVNHPEVQIWVPESAREIQIYSVLNSCVVLPSVRTLVGMMACDRLKVLPRQSTDGPLNLIGTFMIGQLDLPTPLNTAVNFYHLDHPIATQLLNDLGFLRKADGNACPKIYGVSNVMSIITMGAATRQQYKSCQVASIRARASPFTWTAIDPECGFLANSWSCQTPNWFKRFRLFQVSSKGAL